MVAVPVALQGRLPTSWVPSLFGSQRPLEGNRHYALAPRAFNMEGGAYLSEYERLADCRFPVCAESTFIKLLRINHFASTYHLTISLAFSGEYKKQKNFPVNCETRRGFTFRVYIIASIKYFNYGHKKDDCGAAATIRGNPR